MGQDIELSASDGHRLSAYISHPTGAPRGGIAVVQEIFGVNRHIRAVTDQYAAAGFTAIAPALFDRVERNVDVPYTDGPKGRKYVQALKTEKVMLDVEAAIHRINAAGKVGVVGYCWGGTLAYLAAARLNIAAAVVYYGGGIDQNLAEGPRCPIMFHFGEKDTHIPMSTVEKVKTEVPEGIVYLYPAGHGFNCTDRESYDPASAKLSLKRSLEFFRQHVG
jgi:carboxymethylenebutenolidase